MATKKMPAKKTPNAQDATMRNVRAAQKKIDVLIAVADSLEHRVDALEQARHVLDTRLQAIEERAVFAGATLE